MLGLGACFTILLSWLLGIGDVPAGVLVRLGQAGIGLLIAYSVSDCRSRAKQQLTTRP